MVSTTPAFNLKVVLKETGIAADTLRAWERRYGLPMPQRSAGGHRLYSQRDIETIKWLINRQAEGLSISRAVDLWNEQLASGSDPLAGSVPPGSLPTSSANLESLRHDWLAACFKFDTVAAEQILSQAFAVHSVEIICTEVMMRGLHEVGELWHKGASTVQQEHFASEIAMRRLEALISASPAPTRTETILVACPPEEWHTFPLLLITLFLRRRGWNVVYLGAVVPTERMEETIHTVDPKLVVLSAQTLMTAVSMREMARFLQEKDIQTAFGGRVFNHISGLASRIPAHFLGNTIESAIPTIESLIAHPSPVPAEEIIRKRTRQLAALYKQKRPIIESTLLDHLQSRNQTIDYIDTANHFLGNTLTAALELGDISYTSTDIHWLASLLSERNIPLSVLPMFLGLYAQATQGVMGEEGQPVSEWLTAEAQKLNI
ncbi:MAG: MerR family transcriptional regulator [Chloroflexi bacterium]|nr:MAG: MerR family transcriptional regulator [Chloroflexota bacterium]